MRLRTLLAALALALYLASLLLPAMGHGGRLPMHGFEVLVQGPMGVLIGEFRWLVNPLFAVGCLLVFLQKRTTWYLATLAAISLALASSCFVYPPALLTGDSGSPSHLSATLYSGAHVWTAAQAILLIAALVPNSKSEGAHLDA